MAGRPAAHSFAQVVEWFLANLAVAWVASEPGATTALVGARDEAQAVENARALEVRLTVEERHFIRQTFERL